MTIAALGFDVCISRTLSIINRRDTYCSSMRILLPQGHLSLSLPFTHILPLRIPHCLQLSSLASIPVPKTTIALQYWFPVVA